jgi:pyruvate ferredoxin oxidoreductase beta subunit
MNTGRQRSSSTPYGANTTTTPTGKKQHKKNVPLIMASHGIYVATCSVSDIPDLYDKFKKAASLPGCKYIQIMAPCPPGWRYDPADTVSIADLVVKTGMWILYEIEGGKLRLTGKSAKLLDKDQRLPVVEYLSQQGRFNKISEQDIQELQNWVDRNWEELKRWM